MSNPKPSWFAQTEQLHQQAFRAASPTFTQAGRRFGYYKVRPHPAYVSEESWTENLYPAIREEAVAYFADNEIAWHDDANHIRSSQIFCLNFLMPLAHNERYFISALQPALGPIAGILPIEPGHMIAFEWIGEADYLNEGFGPLRSTRATLKYWCGW